MTAELNTPRAWAVLLVLSGAIFLEGIDVSMMGVALPSMRAELDLSTSSLQWVVSAYVLGYGGFVLLGGRAADLLGRRRMLLLWLGVFIAFSGLGGLATEGWMLVARALHDRRRRRRSWRPSACRSSRRTSPPGGRATRRCLIYSGIGGGGLLARHGRRRAADRDRLALGLLRAGADGGGAARRARCGWCRRRPRRSAPRAASTWAAALTLTGGMLLVVAAVVRAPDVALGATAATLAAGAVLLAAFVGDRAPGGRRRSCGSGILRSGPLVRANLGALLFIGAFVAFQFVVVLYLQELRGWSSLETGLALAVAGDRRDPRADADAVARSSASAPSRVTLAGMALAARRLRAVPAARRGLDVRRDAADDDPARRRVLARLRGADDRRDRRASPRRSRASPAACSTSRSSSAPRSGSPWRPRSTCRRPERRGARTSCSTATAPRWSCRSSPR